MRVLWARNLFFIGIAAFLLCGCGSPKVRATLDDAESILDSRSEDALSLLKSVDPGSLGYKPLRMRHTLLLAIALDKNHIDDGHLVTSCAEAASWYSRHGSRRNKLRSTYYYGDQLLGAGRKEEASVQFMRAESMAVRQRDWFLAGMSSRSLYQIFAGSYNAPDERACIERALEYFHRAGKPVHEDDARIKLAASYYNNHEHEKSDSLFDECIRIAREKRDTLRWRMALAWSVDPMLVDEPFRPDSAKARLLRAVALKRRADSRALSSLALAEALLGNKTAAESYLSEAYSFAANLSDSMGVKYREYQMRSAFGESSAAFALLREVYSDTNSAALGALRQSVVKAQNAYLEASNEHYIRAKRMERWLFILALAVLLAVAGMIYLYYKRVVERNRREEEDRQLEIDRYRMASSELCSLGKDFLDKMSSAYYSSGYNEAAVTLKAYLSVVEQFRDASFQEKFLESVDGANEQVITKLKTQMPSLRPNAVLLFSYIIFGFSYTTISVLLNARRTQYIYDRKSRLRSAIIKADPPDKDLFLGYLK